MNWILWLLLLGWAAVPSFLLMADRIFDVESHTVIKGGWFPATLASLAVLVIAGAAAPEYLELVAWGALVGLLGTATLDLVRLLGVRAGVFPLDMPVVFGFMAHGEARTLQRNIMGQVLTNAVGEGRIKEFVSERLERIPRLPRRQRTNAAAAMMGAISTLDQATKNEVTEAQFAVLGSLPEADRRAVMTAMDDAGETALPGQPRGLPRVPFADFRRGAAAGIGKLQRESASLLRRAQNAGYLWHAINGISFGIGYTLLVGRGAWGWAVGWGILVWLAMMVAMPAMMPMLKLPGWFPIVPLIAHIAMIGPYLALTTWVSESADQVSLLGWLNL